MGADGGFRATSITGIRNNWEKLRLKFIDTFENIYLECEKWEEKYYYKIYQECKKLPKKVEKLTDYDLVNLFNFLQYCDCPTLLGEYMITAEGDNVVDFMNTFSYLLNTIEDSNYIETWT